MSAQVLIQIGSLRRTSRDKHCNLTHDLRNVATAFYPNVNKTRQTKTQAMFKWLSSSLSRPKQNYRNSDASDALHPLLGMGFPPDASKSNDEIHTSSEPESALFDTDSVVARSVVRKIDYRIIPLLFVTYNLNFMDKTILSSASVFGLSKDTGLKGQQYSWVSAIFYFGYFFWEYPTTFLIQKLAIGKYVGVNTIL